MTLEPSTKKVQKRGVVEAIKRLLYNPKADTIGMKIAIAANDITYWAWRIVNPRKTYADFYAWRVTNKLERGRAHKTLGKRRIDQDSIIFKPGEHDASSFADGGRVEFAELLKLGMRADQKVVEYGCGSLRIGQHSIGLLAPGHYVGMDITDRFFNDGREIMDQALIAEKRPSFHVISDEAVETVAAWEPDFIYAAAVTQHVPPFELDQYFKRLARMKHAGTRLAIFFVAAEKETRLKGKSWAYEPSQLTTILARHCPDAKLTVQTTAVNRKETKINAWEAVIIAE